MKKIILASVIAAITSTSALAGVSVTTSDKVVNDIDVKVYHLNVDDKIYDVVDAKSTTQALENSHKTLKATSGNKADITKNTNAIQANTDALSKVKNYDTQISDTSNKVDTAITAQTEVNAKQATTNTDHDSRITKNEKQIERVENYDTRISGAETTANRAAAKVDKFDARITKNEKDIFFLKDEVKRLDQGIASVAAMSNLVRPYGVGKANVSVALGGYNSEQSIAVGTGYRYNENTTVQASLATSAGDFEPTWGVGVGYEF